MSLKFIGIEFEMNKEVKLTFLLPTYNDEKYIKTTLTSILNQTFKNWELLIIDKSNDNTEKLLASYIAKFPEKIKYFRQKSEGQLNALVELVPHISGTHVMLIQSDDFIVSDDAILKNINILMSSNADGLYSDLIVVNKEGTAVGKLKSFFSLKKLIITGSNSIPDHFLLKKETFFSHVNPNYLIRNIPYYLKIEEGEILLPNLKYSSEPWYAYRVYDENFALSKTGLFIKSNGEIRFLKDFFSKGFQLFPSFLLTNKYLHYALVFLATRSPRLAENVVKIKKGDNFRALKQLKTLIKFKKFILNRKYKEFSELSVKYIDNVLYSIEDFINFHKIGSNKNKITLNEKNLNEISTLKGKDIRKFINNYLSSNTNKTLYEIFEKKYDIIICDTEKSRQKVAEILDLFNYFTPIIIK